jgi:hypothetical protein
MTTLYVGLDIGSSSCHQVVMQADGQISINRRFSTGEAHLIDAFTGIKGQLHVHLEAGELAPWVRSVIAPLCTRVVISHPPTNAWIHKDPNKRDQIDATKLADLLRMNRVHEAYYAPERSRRDFKQLVQHAASSFPEVELFKAVPGMGPIGACRFSASIQTPHCFSNVRKLWRYCRLGVSRRSSDGKLLSRPRLDRAGCGRLKDVTRKAFDASQRRTDDNAFKRAYERALESTHDKTHARLSVQRKIVSVLRAMWLTLSPYRDQMGSTVRYLIEDRGAMARAH